MSQADPARFNPEPPKRGWFGRNWLWFVPTIIILPILLCGGCFGVIFFAAFSAIKGSDAYKLALERVQQSPEVQAQLGEPITDATTFPSGSVRSMNGEGSAIIYMRVAGPKGSANVVVEAETSGGAWHFDKLEVTTDADGTKIDLGDEHVPSEDDAPAFEPGGNTDAEVEDTGEEAAEKPSPPLEINLE
jgi:hypothetical protein